MLSTLGRQFYTQGRKAGAACRKNEHKKQIGASVGTKAQVVQPREQKMVFQLPILTAFFAVAGLATTIGKRIRLERTVRSNLPFSDAVWHGDTLYLSGHIGLDPKTGHPPSTAEEEARLVLDGVKRTLEAAGLTMDDLLSVQIFCSDVTLFEKFNTIYRTYFKGEFPARAFLGSGKLLFDARFEVQGIAGRK